MVNRINLLLQAKNITARQFAEEIGIQPSGMSHILSGRNNPSLDFVMKVVRRYPEIDINWLMFGKGEMYESGRGGSVVASASAPVSVSTAQVSSSVPSVENGSGQQSMFSDPERSLFSDQQPSPNIQSVENGVKQYGNASEYKEANLVREQKDCNPAPAEPRSVIESNQHLESIKPVDVPSARNEASVSENGAQRPETPLVATVNVPAPKGKRIVRLLAFYDDHTFGEYFPE